MTELLKLNRLQFNSYSIPYYEELFQICKSSISLKDRLFKKTEPLYFDSNKVYDSLTTEELKFNFIRMILDVYTFESMNEGLKFDIKHWFTIMTELEYSKKEYISGLSHLEYVYFESSINNHCTQIMYDIETSVIKKLIIIATSDQYLEISNDEIYDLFRSLTDSDQKLLISRNVISSVEQIPDIDMQIIFDILIEMPGIHGSVMKAIISMLDIRSIDNFNKLYNLILEESTIPTYRLAWIIDVGSHKGFRFEPKILDLIFKELSKKDYLDIQEAIQEYVYLQNARFFELYLESNKDNFVAMAKFRTECPAFDTYLLTLSISCK